ncbi:MAG: outer membrane lipoprotein-sorting protein [Acidobacteria bacterium]|nr:outer membrane lipoprotein-sorting protein [Acidobacteriota bacterium]
MWLALMAFLPGEPTAADIIRRVDELTRGLTQQGHYTMVIVHPDWERVLEFEFWSEGTEKSFIRVDQPIRDKGVSFLKMESEMWQYVPRINRVIKIPPSMMMQSWMGSDFTNDDLVKESSIIDDYEHRLLGTEPTEAGEAWLIELVPKPEAAVVWGKIREWIRKEDYNPIKAEFFNERDELVRVMTYSDFKLMHDRVIPCKMELKQINKPGQLTRLIMSNIRFDEPIENQVFSMQHLRSSR